jgi:hypothetical protein
MRLSAKALTAVKMLKYLGLLNSAGGDEGFEASDPLPIGERRSTFFAPGQRSADRERQEGLGYVGRGCIRALFA